MSTQTFLNLFTYEHMYPIAFGFAFKNCRLLIDTDENRAGDFIEHIDLPITMYVFKQDSNDFEDFVLENEHMT